MYPMVSRYCYGFLKEEPPPYASESGSGVLIAPRPPQVEWKMPSTVPLTLRPPRTRGSSGTKEASDFTGLYRHCPTLTPRC